MTHRIMSRPVGARVPLSPAHVIMWNHSRKHGGWSTRPCASTIRIVGTLHVELLQRSIEAIVHRHEALRTRFVEVDGSPYQCIDDPAKFDLSTLDLSGPVPVEDPEVAHFVTELCSEKVHLSRGPLFVARLFRLSPTDHILACAAEHMISDGTSLGILDKEIWTVYRQMSSGLPVHLPPLPMQFGDYCFSQRKDDLSWREHHLSYWRDRLRGAPQLRLPRADNSIDPSNLPRGELRYFLLGKTMSDRLRTQAEQTRVPLAWLLLAVYSVAMSRWCQQRDLLIVFVSHGRYREEVRPMIGFLASYVYLRLSLSGDLTFTHLVREIQRQIFLAVQHEDFNRVTSMASEWGLSTEGYFNWLPSFGAQGIFDFGQTGQEEFRLRPFPFRLPVSSGFLPLFSDTTEGITLIVDFNSTQFSHAVVERFAADIKWLASAMSERPHARVDDYLDIDPKCDERASH
jgi:hypothetical protein